ncbi:reverse transcriptase domain-containing protein [Trichonephila inaurata madagascariensis]|uniref:Reverse transcriptase domain-containing protein n=1 Tax=Trichonephila inaurata madagascariensis TaxID=2747483 RepID=A0A8X6XPL7_9ARAC|nr:reverse transcriptase domain-containing protein [Trichonephila inaurata madagascariensis]
MNEKLTVNALKNFKNYRKQSINNQKNEFNCKQCGKKHEKKKCPAFGTKCRNCDGRNHWAKMCRTQSKRKNMAARRVNAMEENSENSETIYIGELKSVNELDAKETNCVCDNRVPILGFEACRELGLIQRLNMIYNSPIKTPELFLKEFTDVFTGTGSLKRIVKIKLKETSVTHVAAPRKVPLAIHNKVKEELSNMVDAGHALSDERIKPDSKKIRAIEEFETPNCKDLQRFLGMVTYLAKFTPHLSNLTHNLRQLL